MLTQLDLQDNIQAGLGNWMVKYFEKKRLGFLHDFNISILFVKLVFKYLLKSSSGLSLHINGTVESFLFMGASVNGFVFNLYWYVGT